MEAAYRFQEKYCQKIDALEEKLSVYEVAKESTDKGAIGMVLSPAQCKCLNDELKRLHDIAHKYANTCGKLKRIKAVLNE